MVQKGNNNGKSSSKNPKCCYFGGDYYRMFCTLLKNLCEFCNQQINYVNSNQQSGKTVNNGKQYNSENHWKLTKQKEGEPQTKVVQNNT